LTGREFAIGAIERYGVEEPLELIDEAKET
jgi:hypothetical protein